ncbi:MAPEG family protein [Alcaligenaceae bacterium CGII-47]|nr:MAPEG family protein [Alcaligenaceae bacterium CGII-47]
MGNVASLLLVAAILPYCAAIAAKAGGQAFDNNSPRGWLAAQAGWRGRANAAQANLFEGLPFFYAAVLFALYAGASPERLAALMLAWVLVRVLYIIAYILGRGTIRSFIWGGALVLNLMILFAAA